MGNEQASQIVQGRGMKTNQSETTMHPVVKHNIVGPFGDEDSGFFSENQKPGSAVRNVITEEPSSMHSHILPPNRTETYGSPAKCYSQFIYTVNETDTVIRLVSYFYRAMLC